ncbi:MAG: Mur ligase family protein [Patescibacteria group bacterium]|nr:Mur ligase family protein [Patescibacteria group bacterium]
MQYFFLILFGKLIIKFSQILNLGNGSTWPGHIALSVNRNLIKDVLKNSNIKTILIAGTNGKTTTSKLLQTILENSGKKVFRNESGANLLNGIASSLIANSSLSKINYDYAIFEIDENSLPLVLENITPHFVILLNLFRDQLDRYGEVDSIVRKWKESISKLPKETTLILNADDPQIAYLGQKINAATFYFGLSDKKLNIGKLQHAVDSIYCPNCGKKLDFKSVYFSHLGEWSCLSCELKRPNIDLSKTSSYPLSGIYNMYNTHASSLASLKIGVSESVIDSSLKNFSPAFGRQEKLSIDGKFVQIFLSKNPTSLNESLRTVRDLEEPACNASVSVAGGKNILLALNNRIPDGRDVSWIWDVDFEDFLIDGNITVTGDRAYDMTLRIKYAIKNSELKIKNSLKISNLKFKIEDDLKKAISLALEQTKETETLYILPTYSAMLEVRKILTGKKIL